MARPPTPITPFLLRQSFLLRRLDSHKGDFGHVLVLAGSRGMMGAARLCAAAALRSGAGLVTLGTPESQEALAAQGRWEAMTLPLPETTEGVLHPRAASVVRTFIEKRGVTSLAVGPGLGPAGDFVRELLSDLETPAVLDADGLNALSEGGLRAGTGAPLALTPHPGEAARLLNISTREVQSRRAEAALRLSSERGAVTVLKGSRSLVTDGHQVFINPTGNPGMATGGAGDVLTGLLAGLLGQVQGLAAKDKLLRAAVAAVYIHGLAGDLAAQKMTRLGLLAGDILDALPAAYRKVFGKKI